MYSDPNKEIRRRVRVTLKVFRSFSHSVSKATKAFAEFGRAITCAVKSNREESIQFIKCRKTYLVRFHNGTIPEDLSSEFDLLLLVFGDNNLQRQQRSIPFAAMPQDVAQLFDGTEIGHGVTIIF